MACQPRPALRRTAVVLALAAIAAGPSACGGGGDPAVAPAVSSTESGLAGVRADRNRLLDGGPAAFKQRLAGLKGHPVVVNQWASWCGPCRYEFPFFQALANRYDGRVAFIGVDSQDSRSDAARFIERYPVPFPHYYDKDSSIARLFRGGRAWPTTAFYDSKGRLIFTHQGGYASQAKLEADIGKYSLDG